MAGAVVNNYLTDWVKRVIDNKNAAFVIDDLSSFPFLKRKLISLELIFLQFDIDNLVHTHFMIDNKSLQYAGCFCHEPNLMTLAPISLL